MKTQIVTSLLRSLIIAIIGVFVIDYFSHLLFSSPMETIDYFLAKTVLYFIFSFVAFLVFSFQKKELEPISKTIFDS